MYILNLSISDIDDRADLVMNFVKAENSRLSFCSFSEHAVLEYIIS